MKRHARSETLGGMVSVGLESSNVLPKNKRTMIAGTAAAGFAVGLATGVQVSLGICSYC